MVSWVISPITGRKIKVGGGAYGKLSLAQKRGLTPFPQGKKLKSRIQKEKKSVPKKMGSAITDPTKVYVLIYSGPALNEETTILITTTSHEKLKEYMRWIAEMQGLHGTLLCQDDLVYEEIMIETYDIQYATFDQIMADPYSYDHWGEDSLWAIVNHDFSKITNGRLEKLMKKMDLPKLEFSTKRQQELLEQYAPDIRYDLVRHHETTELVPILGIKGRFGVMPDGKLVPIYGAKRTQKAK